MTADCHKNENLARINLLKFVETVPVKQRSSLEHKKQLHATSARFGIFGVSRRRSFLYRIAGNRSNGSVPPHAGNLVTYILATAVCKMRDAFCRRFSVQEGRQEGRGRPTLLASRSVLAAPLLKKEFGFSCNRFLRSAGGSAFFISVRWWFYWNPLTVWSELPSPEAELAWRKGGTQDQEARPLPRPGRVLGQRV